MSLNGISTATSSTPTLTKVLRRDLKLAEAQAKRRSSTSTWYRPLNILSGTHDAYVNGSTGAELVTLSGSASPTQGHPWSTGTAVTTYGIEFRTYNTSTNTPGDTTSTCNEGELISFDIYGTNIPTLPDAYLQFSGANITNQDVTTFGPFNVLDPIPLFGISGDIPPGVGAVLGINPDNLTEGNETLTVTWYINSTTIATATSITIVDTSITPITPLLSLDAGDVTSYSGSGTVWTDTVGGMTFDLINGPTYNSADGGYLHFTPSSGQYAVSTATLGTLANWTIEAWHYYEGTNTPTGDCIFTETYGGGEINLTLGSTDGSAGDLQTAYYRGGWQTTNSGYKLTTSTWHHVVGTFDGVALKLYVDGTLVNSTANAGPAGTTGNQGYRLMSRWDAGGLWGGRLSVVRVYNSAISLANIDSNFNTEKSRYGL